MSGRKDPWLPGPAVIVHADEAHALLPVLEHGLREWHRMGAVHRLKAVADLLAPWRHLAELHDQRLRGSAGGTPVSSGVAGFVTVVS